MTIKEIIEKNPSAVKITEEIEQYALSVLPFSIGLEFECTIGSTNVAEFSKKFLNFTKANEFLDSKYCVYETSFRICNGLKGLKQLYNISEFMKANYNKNELAGIHYHVDMSDWWDIFQYEKVNETTTLKYFDSWEYPYEERPNSRVLGYNIKFTAVNFRPSFKTCEIRVGICEFDYKELYGKVASGCFYVETLKSFFLENCEEFRESRLRLLELSKLKTVYENESLELKRLIEMNPSIINEDFNAMQQSIRTLTILIE